MESPTGSRHKLNFFLIPLFLIIVSFQTSLLAERVVSLAPGLTEIIFALDKGKELAGTTKFCNYPEEANHIQKLGGLLDLNLEALISVKPDVIFHYPEHKEKLKVLIGRIKLVNVKHGDLNDLYESIRVISKELNTPQKGNLLIEHIKQTLKDIHKKSALKKKVKTLIIVGRNPDQLSQMYILGRKDFLNEILEIAGGTNAYTGNILYPNISIESVVAMKPDLIMELSNFYQGIDQNKVNRLWEKYRFIPAVKKKRIIAIQNDFWLRPGPRVTQIATELFKILFDQ
jgi:iron complex transport system substrate-binding protein